MRIACIGTDPAGLYLASLLKSRHPGHDVRVLVPDGDAGRQAAPPHVLVNPVKPELRLADPLLQDRIMAAATATRGTRIQRDGDEIATSGQPYTTVAAAALSDIVRRHAETIGVTVDKGPAAPDDIAGIADLVVIADGVESPLRARLGNAFGPALKVSGMRHMVFDCAGFTEQPAFLFRRTRHGLVHAYVWPAPRGATVVVEAAAATLTAAGLDAKSPAECAAAIAGMFNGELAGQQLTPRSDRWRAFVGVKNRAWSTGNVVLLGAAAYNAHLSIGLGVRSGLEDAEALATMLAGARDPAEALKRHEAARRPRAESLQRASAASLAWFETAHRYIDMALPQFAYSFLTRGMRLNHEAMRTLAPELTDTVERLVAGNAVPSSTRPPPPMFTPITLRGLTIPNRIAMSPMCMYNATDGTVGDFHLVHYGSRAVGGAGLILTEMTDVSPEGRISAHCAGMYKPEHVAAWRRVTDFVHARTTAKIGVQLGHAGRKGAEPKPWERARHRGGPAWQTIAPSPIPFQPDGPAPREVTRADMDRLIAAYSQAARMSDEAGFDLIELHFAHGYLLSTFISPLANQRTDKYGGTLANRLRFPMEVFEAVRAAWPADKPMSVRISATDWTEGGTTIEDAIAIGRILRDAGNDILTVSTGGVTAGPRPQSGRLYQATFSDQVRNELKIATMSVGGIVSHGDINAMIAAGRADICVVGRGHLYDPYLTRHAAHDQGFTDIPWPDEYERVTSIDFGD